jgi:hypothetical protein
MEVRGYPIVDTLSPSVTPLEEVNWNGSSRQVAANFEWSVRRNTARSFTASRIATSAVTPSFQPGKATLMFFASRIAVVEPRRSDQTPELELTVASWLLQ